MNDVNEAMKALEYSIRQSFRKVDVMSRVSESQYLLVLTEAHTQTSHIIFIFTYVDFAILLVILRKLS